LESLKGNRGAGEGHRLRALLQCKLASFAPQALTIGPHRRSACRHLLKSRDNGYVGFGHPVPLVAGSRYARSLVNLA
jgi:hypothetical protein